MRAHAFAVVLAASCTPALAHAPPPPPPPPPPLCGPYAVTVARLASRYGETLQGLGVASADSVVTVFANARTGTWSILATDTAGLACLVAAGQSWVGVLRGVPL